MLSLGAIGEESLREVLLHAVGFQCHRCCRYVAHWAPRRVTVIDTGASWKAEKYEREAYWRNIGQAEWRVEEVSDA